MLFNSSLQSVISYKQHLNFRQDPLKNNKNTLVMFDDIQLIRYLSDNIPQSLHI